MTYLYDTLMRYFKNYLKLIRFDKPIGTLLLLWPTLWGLWVASQGVPNYWLVVVFIVGVFLMRSAGCIINDICDRNFDGFVARTKDRPLVTNQYKDRVSLTEAVILTMVFILLAFLLVLSLQNQKLIMHSVIALLLASIYPCCKRFFACPQFVLGLAFGYGIPMTFIAVRGEISSIAWLLYTASVILTVIYDSFYAMTDIEDDSVLGLKSSVIWFGKYNLYIIAALQFSFILNLIIISYILKFKAYYCAIFLVLLLFIYQLKLVNSNQPKSTIRAFKNSNWIGLIIFIGFVVEYLGVSAWLY